VIRAAECLNDLPVETATIWDATLGLGGHSAALQKAYARAELYGSDADGQMLELARAKLGDQFVYAHGNFSEEPFAPRIDWGFVLLDLGISSAHFDYWQRGFSFRFDQPLDMRMNATSGETAAAILKNYAEAELARIFFEFGDEKLSRRIARDIVISRSSKPIETTFELAEICRRAYPPKHKAKGHADRHPATRVFQALRIAVNGELDALEKALAFMPDRLAVGGRLAIITFHSLEDRIVKRAFKARAMIEQKDPRARSNFVAGDFKLVEPGGIAPSDIEIARNPRARSARLRILERVR